MQWRNFWYTLPVYASEPTSGFPCFPEERKISIGSMQYYLVLSNVNAMAPSIVERTANYSVNIEMVMGVPGDDQYFLECSRISCTVGQTEHLSGIPTILEAVQDANGTKVFQEWGNWDFTRDITSIHIWIPNEYNKYRDLAVYYITPETDMNISIWTQVRRDLLDDGARTILRREVPIVRVHLDKVKAEKYLERLHYRVEGDAPTPELLTPEPVISGQEQRSANL